MDVQFVGMLLNALHQCPERAFQVRILRLGVGMKGGVESCAGGREGRAEGLRAGRWTGGWRGAGRGDGRRGRDVAGGAHREVRASRSGIGRAQVGRAQRLGIAGGEFDGIGMTCIPPVIVGVGGGSPDGGGC